MIFSQPRPVGPKVTRRAEPIVPIPLIEHDAMIWIAAGLVAATAHCHCHDC